MIPLSQDQWILTPTVCKSSPFPTSSLPLADFFSFVRVILTGLRRNLKVIWNYIDLITNNIEHFKIFIGKSYFFPWELSVFVDCHVSSLFMCEGGVLIVITLYVYWPLEWSVTEQQFFSSFVGCLFFPAHSFFSYIGTFDFI